MKKATPLSRVIDLFTTAPIEQLDQLLDAAKQITRNRRERQNPTRRRGPRAEPSAEAGKEQ